MGFRASGAKKDIRDEASDLDGSMPCFIWLVFPTTRWATCPALTYEINHIASVRLASSKTGRNHTLYLFILMQ